MVDGAHGYGLMSLDNINNDKSFVKKLEKNNNEFSVYGT